MSKKVLIIGAGGVGNVVAHKCAMAPEFFSEVMLASRNENKCKAVAADVKAATGRTIRTAAVDADDVKATVALIRAFGADLLINVALPTEALTVWMMLMSSVAFWALALALEPWPTWQFSGPMVWSLLWAAFINYGAAQVIWVGMARKLPPAASTFAIMAVPLVGIGAAALVVGEVPRLLDYVAAAFVVVAIAVSVGWGKRTGSRPSAASDRA